MWRRPSVGHKSNSAEARGPVMVPWGPRTSSDFVKGNGEFRVWILSEYSYCVSEYSDFVFKNTWRESILSVIQHGYTTLRSFLWTLDSGFGECNMVGRFPVGEHSYMTRCIRCTSQRMVLPIWMIGLRQFSWHMLRHWLSVPMPLTEYFSLPCMTNFDDQMIIGKAIYQMIIGKGTCRQPEGCHTGWPYTVGQNPSYLAINCHLWILYKHGREECWQQLRFEHPPVVILTWIFK